MIGVSQLKIRWAMAQLPFGGSVRMGHFARGHTLMPHPAAVAGHDAPAEEFWQPFGTQKD